MKHGIPSLESLGFSAAHAPALPAGTSGAYRLFDDFRGRIMALYAMTVVGLGPFGSLAAGAIANTVGARWTVFAGGALTVVAAWVFQLKSHE